MSGSAITRISMQDIAAGRLPDILQSQQVQKLIESAKDGNIEQVRKLLKIPGIDVNQADSNGNTALMWAAANGRQEVVKELLQNKKVDVNQADSNGNTALILAAGNGQQEVVKVIMAKLGLKDIEITS